MVMEREGTMEDRDSIAVWTFSGESAAETVVASSPDIVCV